MRFPARLTLVLALFLTVFASIAFPSFAQTQQATTPSTMQILSPLDNNVPPTIGNVSQGILWGVFSFLSCAISGKDVTNPSQTCLGYNPQTNKLGYVQGQKGLLGMASNGIAMLYSPPQFHVSSYISYLENNFGLVKKTYAAGPTGFDQLAPILKLWIAFRNVTYVLFVIVFVVVGFAVMLRAKIDPRTVMTIENQIPKLIVALLLVSFSYAIAGFIIDIMWLMTFVTINLFATLDPSIQTAALTYNVSLNPLAVLNALSTGGILGLIRQPASSVYDIFVPITKNAMNAFPAIALPGIIPCFLQGIGSFITNPGGSIISAVSGTGGDLGKCVNDSYIAMQAGTAGVIAFIIFAFALGFALFRMYFALLKSYALFLIYAIMGPFFIMIGALPGTKINFDNWVRHLLAYSLVFPYALGIMLLGKTISDVYSGTKVGFVPPLIGIPQNAASPIGPLIGFAILLLMPQALTMLQDALSAPDIKYLPGIGQMMAQGTQAYTSFVSKPWQRITRRENKMEGLSEGGLRSLVLGKAGSWQRKFLGDQGGKP